MSRRPGLFDVVGRKKRGNGKFNVPRWWRPEDNQTEVVDTYQSVVSTPSTPSTPSAVDAVENAKQWLNGSVSVNVSRITVVLLAAISVGLPVITYLIGREQQQVVEPVVAVTPSAEAVNGMNSSSTQTASVLPSGGVSTASAADIIYDNFNDPRVSGLNYFCLATIPKAGRDHGLRAVEFLSRNEVDAQLVADHNGRSLKLVALKGFEKPGSDADAREYEYLLRTLGRKWKRLHKGASDWSDLYAEKYRPRNG